MIKLQFWIQEILLLNKVGFRLLKNLKKRSSTWLKKISANVPQNKSVVYDCILDENKTIEAPDIKVDVIDKYTAAYHKLIDELPRAFHKKKLNFSHFVDISRPERELSKSKSPKNENRELPKICSRNWVIQHLSAKGEKHIDVMNFRTQEDARKNSKAIIQRSISPVENFLIQRKKKSLTENLFLNKRMISISQIKERVKQNWSMQDSSTPSAAQKQDSYNTEYTDSIIESIKKQNRIKSNVNKSLVNGDEKWLKSLKILLKKTNKIYGINKFPIENNISKGETTNLNPYSNELNFQNMPKMTRDFGRNAKNNFSIDVDEGQGFTWQYLNESMRSLEERIINSKKEHNLFLKPIKYLKNKNI